MNTAHLLHSALQRIPGVAPRQIGIAVVVFADKKIQIFLYPLQIVRHQSVYGAVKPFLLGGRQMYFRFLQQQGKVVQAKPLALLHIAAELCLFQ